MFYKRENMSFECLNPNSQYRVHISRPRGKNGFFAVRCRFSALFENSICGFFLEISEGTEISTVKISGKKLMILVHLPYKYLSHTTITLEYIGKTNRLFFFRPHSTNLLRKVRALDSPYFSERRSKNAPDFPY